LSLAAGHHDVIVAVHHAAEVHEMRVEATARGVSLRVERLDLLSDVDREAARGGGVDVLVNNAAIGEGGPIAEIIVTRGGEYFFMPGLRALRWIADLPAD
jgi:NAD(P)-dependent dehydrogenase (short-subunit alcohol dehydrogenase family)